MALCQVIFSWQAYFKEQQVLRWGRIYNKVLDILYSPLPQNISSVYFSMLPSQQKLCYSLRYVIFFVCYFIDKNHIKQIYYNIVVVYC